MFELTDVNSISACSKKEFKKEVTELILKTYNKYRVDCCILYNCTNFRVSRKIRRLGFKKVYEYSGFDNYNLVSVYLLEINKTSFLRKLFNLPRVKY